MARKLTVLFLAICILSALLCVSVSADAEENIAYKHTYTVTTGEPTESSYSRYGDGDGISVVKLTNGKRGGLDTSDSAYYRAFRSKSRLITFDFEKTVTVCGIEAGFLHNASQAYYAPRYVNLYLSDDGEQWQMVGTVKPDFSLSSKPRNYEAVIRIEKTNARYVRVEYAVDIYSLCDEIRVMGFENAQEGAKTVVPDPEEETGYCTGLKNHPEVTDIIKMYNGYYPPHQEKVLNDAEDLLPYIAYLDKDGNIADTMFDAVAFVPCVSGDWTYPSGGILTASTKHPGAVMTDYIYYTDFLFKEGYELDALNQVVGQVYGALSINKKFPVLLTMPNIGFPSGAFGDIDGDGKDEFCRNEEERLAVVEWYDRYLTKRFEEADFENLEFIGYYWYGEVVDSSRSEDEEGFVTRANAILTGKGKEVLFDPYYLSIGYDEWQELGFTSAVMQPNLAFRSHHPYFKTSMLEEFAQTIAKEHLGVEMETDEPSYFRGEEMVEAAAYYERYIYVGYKTGYMSSLHTFYQGAGPGSLYDFCKADTKSLNGLRLRRLYDITYQFIKETYENKAPEIAGELTAHATAGERCELPITITDSDSFPQDVKITLSEAAHGTVKVLPTKKIVYLSDADFTGTEELTMTVEDGMNEPITAAVRIEVGKTEPAESSTEDSDESYTALSGIVILLIVLGAVLVCAAAVVLILVLRKRKGA